MKSRGFKRQGDSAD